jgi:hypothetical protein
LIVYRIVTASIGVVVCAALPAWAQLSGTTEGYAPPVSYGGMNDPRGMTIADFNGDGRPDVIVADNLANRVSLYRGNANGTFQAPLHTPMPAASHPQFVAAGDVNGDGNIDAVVGNVMTETVSVLLGNGAGTFTSAPLVTMGGLPRSVALGDVDSDGRADLLVANVDTGNVDVLLGNGDGTFQAAASYVAGAAPQELTLADFNNDGHIDVAVAVASSNRVAVLLNSGTGTFPIVTLYPAGGLPVRWQRRTSTATATSIWPSASMRLRWPSCSTTALGRFRPRRRIPLERS